MGDKTELPKKKKLKKVLAKLKENGDDIDAVKAQRYIKWKHRDKFVNRGNWKWEAEVQDKKRKRRAKNNPRKWWIKN
jgi:hypothetical protein